MAMSNPNAMRCPSCGAAIPAPRTCLEMRDELFHYTLTHGGKEFIHQHAVDAYAAQHIRPKPISLAGALIGLFLFVERGFTGREVQQAHMALGNRMKLWPAFPAPGIMRRSRLWIRLRRPPEPSATR